ncbi:SDR family NAD(P)-dependent oxidoreductase [Streptomyces sp. NPDC053048]|uniref:SDR family NAD(P)-dependent oxidoreductase n=1 Tax=Streptomyces sp. NPDC053048 TaxID=3365694 RepID=UPI0037CE6D4B
MNHRDRTRPTSGPARPDRLTRRLARRVSGRRVLVTGASGAIGRRLAILLSRAGADLILLGRDRDALHETARRTRGGTGTARVFPVDLTVHEEVTAFIKQVIAEYGGADVLVNNAGRSIRRGTVNAALRTHDYRRTMAVNYFGAVDLTLGLLPGMRRRGHGHIVNITTIGLQLGMSRFTAYNPSKAALEAFGQSLAPELRREGIAVSTVHLPLVRTPMSAPTTAFARLPALEPEQAARMVATALITGRPKVSTRIGTLGELLGVAAPRLRLALGALEYRYLPESPSAAGTVPAVHEGPEPMGRRPMGETT